jgi:hypothetical protein
MVNDVVLVILHYAAHIDTGVEVVTWPHRILEVARLPNTTLYPAILDRTLVSVPRSSSLTLRESQRKVPLTVPNDILLCHIAGTGML